MDSDQEPAVRAELFVGLVGALGTRLEELERQLGIALDKFGYEARPVRLSSLLARLDGLPPLIVQPEERRLETHMEAGTALREGTARGEALAALASMQIRGLRAKANDSRQRPPAATAYILRSLKNPREVEELRRVYKDHFVLVGAYTSREERVTNVAQEIASSHGSPKATRFRDRAERLVALDEKERDRPLGQNVSETFPLADYFVHLSVPPAIEAEIARLLDLVFGHPFITPTVDEYGMFQAQAAALRSAALGRQVGAAILSADGDVIATGMNEVPRSGGGHYWTGDPEDARDYKLGHDPNDRMKRTITKQVIEHLRKAKWLSKRVPSELDQALEAALDREGPLRGTWLSSLTEFGRDVHAEMSALMAAARRGVSVKGATLYSTTFPCHNCAKHIIAAGIARVVYVEPYAKSFAVESHPDAIDETLRSVIGRLPFVPFEGVAPRRYVPWFTMPDRKDGTGKAVDWLPRSALPRFHFEDPGYIERERLFVNGLIGAMERAEIGFKEER